MTPLYPKKGGEYIINLNTHKRQSIRLKEYNYKKEGMYFITICIKDRESLLGEIKENKMYLNNLGKIVEKELLYTMSKYQENSINIYTIMPNHIHFILELTKENEFTIGNMIRHFKGRTSSKAKIKWQRNYYEHIIRNDGEYSKIYNYIENNPANWKEDGNYM